MSQQKIQETLHQKYLNEYLNKNISTTYSTISRKLAKKRAKWIHISSAPLLAKAFYGEEVANKLYNVKGTLCKRCQTRKASTASL